MEHADGHLANELARSFVTLPGEGLLLAKRKHWFVLAFPLAITIIVLSFLLALTPFLFLAVIFSPTLFIASILAISIVGLFLVTKLIVDWYCHIYIVTNRKILELCYSPFFSYNVNDVLLDQVRCTEVDVREDGVLRELLDMGDIAVTFDRPTHQEEFIFLSLKNPKKVGIFLGDVLEAGTTNGNTNSNLNPKRVWYKNKEAAKYRFMEEIFPNTSVEV